MSLLILECNLNFLRHDLLLFHKNSEIAFPFAEFKCQEYDISHSTTVTYLSIKITRLYGLSHLPPSKENSVHPS